MTAFAIARAGVARTYLGDLVAHATGTVSEAVPLELLLAHRAGLEANLPLFDPLLHGRRVDVHEALTRAAHARRVDAQGNVPDEGFAPLYSDLGYVLAGAAVARASGVEDAGHAIGRWVVDPLGLADDLGTARSLEARGERARFHERVVSTEIVDWRGGEIRGLVHDENAFALTGAGASGHAGMFGTVGAVLTFAAAACDAIVHHDGPLACAYDLAWMVRPRPLGSLRAGFDGKSEDGISSAGLRSGPRTFGHLGFTGTSFWIDPDANAIAVLLTNRVHPTRANAKIRAARPLAHDTLFAKAHGE
jgi:CubicO group peptidase (beta-lactamase class C family)